jgi:hypothetical protein
MKCLNCPRGLIGWAVRRLVWVKSSENEIRSE